MPISLVPNNINHSFDKVRVYAPTDVFDPSVPSVDVPIHPETTVHIADLKPLLLSRIGAQTTEANLTKVKFFLKANVVPPSGLFALLPPLNPGSTSYCGIEYAEESKPDAGLVSLLRSHIPVKLTDTKLSVQILEDSGTCTLTQTYLAPDQDCPSGVFFFQLPSGSAVHGLNITTVPPPSSNFPISTVNATVIEKKKAYRRYQAALSSGKGAYILEKAATSEEVYKLSIGNLPTQARVIVSLSFAVRLSLSVTATDNNGGSRPVYAMNFPRNLLHRYDPPHHLLGFITKADDYYGPSDVMGGVVNTVARSVLDNFREPSLSVDVNAVSQWGVEQIKIPSHSSYVTNEGIHPANPHVREAQVQLPALHGNATNQEIMDHHDDVMIEILPRGAPAAIAKNAAYGWVEDCGLVRPLTETNDPPPSSEHLYVGRVSLSHRWALNQLGMENNEPMPTEIMFLVDCSGSMDGDRIAAAAKVLRLAVRSVPVGSYFNILRFGSSYKPLFTGDSFDRPESRLLDDDNLAAADHLIDTLQADLGGTELLEPLRCLCDAPRIKRNGTALPRYIVVLTDGEVSNTREVIAVGARAAKAVNRSDPTQTPLRILTVGIGNGVSTELIEKLAQDTDGAFTYAKDGERFEPKIIQLMGSAMKNDAVDVRVNWGHESTNDDTIDMTMLNALTENPLKDNLVLAKSALPTRCTLLGGNNGILYGMWKMGRPVTNQTSSSVPIIGTNASITLTLGTKRVTVPLEVYTPTETTNVNVTKTAFVPVQPVYGHTLRVSAVNAILTSLANEEDALHVKHALSSYEQREIYESAPGAPSSATNKLGPDAAEILSLVRAQIAVSESQNVLGRHTAFYAEEEFLDRRNLIAVRNRWRRIGVHDPFTDLPTPSETVNNLQGIVSRATVTGGKGKVATNGKNSFGVESFNDTEVFTVPDSALLSDCGVIQYRNETTEPLNRLILKDDIPLPSVTIPVRYYMKNYAVNGSNDPLPIPSDYFNVVPSSLTSVMIDTLTAFRPLSLVMKDMMDEIRTRMNPNSSDASAIETVLFSTENDSTLDHRRSCVSGYQIMQAYTDSSRFARVVLTDGPPVPPMKVPVNITTPTGSTVVTNMVTEFTVYRKLFDDVRTNTFFTLGPIIAGLKERLVARGLADDAYRIDPKEPITLKKELDDGTIIDLPDDEANLPLPLLLQRFDAQDYKLRLELRTYQRKPYDIYLIGTNNAKVTAQVDRLDPIAVVYSLAEKHKLALGFGADDTALECHETRRIPSNIVKERTFGDVSWGVGKEFHIYSIPKRHGNGQVFCKTLTGKTVTIDFDYNDTVYETKQKIEEREGIPASQIRLVYAGKSLEDHRTLAEYNMDPGSTFHIVLRLRGDGGDAGSMNTRMPMSAPMSMMRAVNSSRSPSPDASNVGGTTARSSYPRMGSMSGMTNTQPLSSSSSNGMNESETLKRMEKLYRLQRSDGSFTSIGGSDIANIGKLIGSWLRTFTVLRKMVKDAKMDIDNISDQELFPYALRMVRNVLEKLYGNAPVAELEQRVGVDVWNRLLTTCLVVTYITTEGTSALTTLDLFVDRSKQWITKVFGRDVKLGNGWGDKDLIVPSITNGIIGGK